MVCEYCGSKELMIESSDITIERIKSETRKSGYQTVRDLKEIEYKQHESQKDLELEKLYYDEKKENRKNKRELKAALITFVVLGLVFAVLIAGLSLAEKRDAAIGKIIIPSSSEAYIGTNYQAVMNELSDAGFTNIMLRPLNDLLETEFEKVNTVYKIMINSKTEFNAKDRFFPDVPIYIYYHVLPEDQDN